MPQPTPPKLRPPAHPAATPPAGPRPATGSVFAESQVGRYLQRLEQGRPQSPQPPVRDIRTPAPAAPATRQAPGPWPPKEVPPGQPTQSQIIRPQNAPDRQEKTRFQPQENGHLAGPGPSTNLPRLASSSGPAAKAPPSSPQSGQTSAPVAAPVPPEPPAPADAVPKDLTGTEAPPVRPAPAPAAPEAAPAPPAQPPITKDTAPAPAASPASASAPAPARPPAAPVPGKPAPPAPAAPSAPAPAAREATKFETLHVRPKSPPAAVAAAAGENLALSIPAYGLGVAAAVTGSMRKAAMQVKEDEVTDGKTAAPVKTDARGRKVPVNPPTKPAPKPPAAQTAPATPHAKPPQTPPPPAAPKGPLEDTERRRLESEAEDQEEEARQRLIGNIEKRMQDRNKANPRAMRDPHPGYSREEDAARLKNLKDGGPLNKEDLNEIHFTDREFFDRLHTTRTALTDDDQAHQSHAAEAEKQQAAEQDRQFFEHSPKAWARNHEKQVAEMPVEALPAYIQQQAEVIRERKAALDGQGHALVQEDAALRQTLADLTERNRELLRRDGIQPPASGPGAWHPELADEAEAAKNRYSKLQDGVLQYQDASTRFNQEAERRLAPLQQAQARLGQTQAADQTRRLEDVRYLGAPGADLAAGEMETLAAEQQAALQKLHEEHPEGIPAEKMQAFQQEAAAGQAQIQQRLQQRAEAAQKWHQAIQSRLSEASGLSDAEAARLLAGQREVAVQDLARTTGLPEQEARQLLEDTEAQDWSSYRAGEEKPGFFGSDERETRMLSNGALIVHPRLHGDTQAYVDAVNRSNVSPEAKRVALDMQPEVRRQWAAQIADNLMSEQNFPGLPSFNKWLAEKQEEDQQTRGGLGLARLDTPDLVLRYVDEMNQRPGWQKHADTFTRRFVTASGNVAASALGLASMALKYTPANFVLQQATGIDPSEHLAEGAAAWTRSNNSFSTSLEQKGGLATWDLKATAILADVIPQVASSVMGGAALKGLQLSRWLSTAAIGGSQSTGQTFTSMYTEMRDKGMSPEEAFKATLPAAVSAGAATAVLGVVMDKVGKTGLDNLGKSLQNPAVKKAVTESWRQQFKNLAGKTAAAGAGTTKEMVEETADSLINEVIQALAKNPDAKLDEVIAGVLQQTPEILASVAEMGALTKGGGGRPGGGAGGTPPALPGMNTPTLPAMPVPPQPLPLPQASVAAPVPVPVTAPAPVDAPVDAPANPAPAATDPQARASQNDVPPPPGPSHQGERLARSPLKHQPDTPRQDTSQNDVNLTPAQPIQGDAPARSPIQQHPGEVRQDTSPTDVNHRNPQTTTNNRTTTPPIWQGRARRGESAAILGRNPDGTFQVSLNGVEKTFTEPNLAGMLDMRKGPLHAMLGQATQQQLAQPRNTTSTLPIWQGRSFKGEPVSVLSRNPDGTFQTLIHGQEVTRTERDIAQMLNLRKGPLHEMLGQATKGRLSGSFEASPTSGVQESSTPRRSSPLDTLTQNLPANKNPLPANFRQPQNLNELRSMLQPMQAEARQLMNDSRKLEVEQRLIESDISKSTISPQIKLDLEIRNNKVIKELEILAARRLELAAQTRLLVAISPDNRGQVNWKHKLVLDLGSQAAAAGDLTAQYINPHLMPSLTVQQSSHGDANAKYDPVQQTIKIRPGITSLSDTMHEIVHGIEHQFPEILGKSKSFLSRRAEGEAPVPMASIMDGFAKKPNAMGFRDKWWKRGGTHYSGRFYTDTSGEIIATEILTTGIQRLHTSPIEFFTSDPDFFDFIITTLRFP